MTREELLQAAVRCKKTDRVPVAPMVLLYAARHAGMMMDCFVHKQRKAFDAIKRTFADLGGWDVLYALCGYDPLVYSLEVPVRLRLPGRELPPNEIWQADEREVIKAEDYRSIVRKGWNWFFRHSGGTLHLPECQAGKCAGPPGFGEGISPSPLSSRDSDAQLLETIAERAGVHP